MTARNDPDGWGPCLKAISGAMALHGPYHGSSTGAATGQLVRVLIRHRTGLISIGLVGTEAGRSAREMALMCSSRVDLIVGKLMDVPLVVWKFVQIGKVGSRTLVLVGSSALGIFALVRNR